MSEFIDQLSDVLKNDSCVTDGEIRRTVAGLGYIVRGDGHDHGRNPIKRLFGELIGKGHPASREEVISFIKKCKSPWSPDALYFNTGSPAHRFIVPAALCNGALTVLDYRKTIELNLYLAQLLPNTNTLHLVLDAPPLHKIAILLALQLHSLAVARDYENAATRYYRILDGLIPKLDTSEGSEGGDNEPAENYPTSIARCWFFCRDTHKLQNWSPLPELTRREDFLMVGYTLGVHRTMESLIDSLGIPKEVCEDKPRLAESVGRIRGIFSQDAIISEAFSAAASADPNKEVLHIPDRAGILTLTYCFNRAVSRYRGGCSPVLTAIADILSDGAIPSDPILFDMVKANAFVLMALIELTDFNPGIYSVLEVVIRQHCEELIRMLELRLPNKSEPPKPAVIPEDPNEVAVQWILKYAKGFSTSVHSVTFADGTTRTFAKSAFENQLDTVQAELTAGKQRNT